VNREVAQLWSDALGAAGTVIRYGHWGRPVLAFPSEQGQAGDFENHGMIGAVAALVDAGRIKVYCVDSYDAVSWSNRDIPRWRCAFPAATTGLPGVPRWLITCRGSADDGSLH
jgi:esterase/lipase superfamily enzyme